MKIKFITIAFFLFIVFILSGKIAFSQNATVFGSIKDTAGNPLAVMESTVGAAQIFGAHAVAIADDSAMLSRNLADRNAQIAILTTADDGHVARHREASLITLRAEHYEHHLHVFSLPKQI